MFFEGHEQLMNFLNEMESRISNDQTLGAGTYSLLNCRGGGGGILQGL